MKVGDLVQVKLRYSEWGYGIGIFLGPAITGSGCRVLFEDRVLVFMRYELEAVNEDR